MILEIFRAAVHSVGTATTMTAAGVYLHRRGMITTETKTGMARYTQQIAIPCLFFTKIVDCPQNFAENEQCPNILAHLRDAWVLLIWPLYVLGVGLLVGKLMIYVAKPPKWQNNCVLAATAFANAMGMPITLLDVIGHNFKPPSDILMDPALDPSMFQSIYVILNPVLQWGLGGWLLSNDEHEQDGKKAESHKNDDEHDVGPETYKGHTSDESDEEVPLNDDHEFGPTLTSSYRRKVLSFISLEDAGYSTDDSSDLLPDENDANDDQCFKDKVGEYTNYGSSWEIDPKAKGTYFNPGSTSTGYTSTATEEEEQMIKVINVHNERFSSTKRGHDKKCTPYNSGDDVDDWRSILKKMLKKAMQPPAIGALAGFVVASYSPLRGLFVDLKHRADNAPLEWIFDGILILAKSAIPVNMCVVGVNLSIASQRRTSSSHSTHASPKTIAAVVIGKMLIMPLIGIITVWLLKTFVWEIPEGIKFQFYLVLLMNFVTPTANVVMVIAELGSGPDSKNVMASLIGWQYVVAPVMLSLTVMMIVSTAISK